MLFFAGERKTENMEDIRLPEHPAAREEYARLQGFPDDYPFAGGKVASLKQIGNAVSPYMARRIGVEILRYLDTVCPDGSRYNYHHHTVVRKEMFG